MSGCTSGDVGSGRATAETAGTTTTTASGGEVTSTTSTTAAVTTTRPESDPLVPFAAGALAPGEQKAFAHTSADGGEFEYLLYLPVGHRAETTWPIIVSLHGFLGFSDQSIESVRSANPLTWLDPDVEFPFILISPLAPGGPWPTLHDPLEELFAGLEAPLGLDRSHVFVTGLSAGSVGVWQWAIKHPDAFAGIATVAGGAASFGADPVPEGLCGLGDLPVWAGHGDADTEVPIEALASVVDALRDCGSATVEFTIYQGLDHFDSIAAFYAGPDLYEWMLGVIGRDGSA